MLGPVVEANYVSGDDYVIEFQDHRFGFNASDFEQRVTAAAVKLGLVADNDWTRTRPPTSSSSSGGTGRRAAQWPRPLPGAPLGTGLPRGRRVARLLAEEADLPSAWLDHGSRKGCSTSPGTSSWPTSPTAIRTATERCSSSRPCRPGTTGNSGGDPRRPDRRLCRGSPRGGPPGRAPGQLLLGALTWIVLIAAARPLPVERRAQVAVVICAATVAELTGSILWGVYSYRLHNLPTFVPPAHGLVFMAGLALSEALRRHAPARAGRRRDRPRLGRPRPDGAPTHGCSRRTRCPAPRRLPLALARTRRLRRGLRGRRGAGALRDGDRDVALGGGAPGSRDPDGNPPSGVASGYVWFDVMALLLVPRLLALVDRTWPSRGRPVPGIGQV